MRYLSFLLLSIIVFGSCDNHAFDSDKRQLMAKDEIRHQLRRARSFDIIAFKEDTVKNFSDTSFKNVLSYTLDFKYTDSNGDLQQKQGVVFFTPNGKSIISSQITDKH